MIKTDSGVRITSSSSIEPDGREDNAGDNNIILFVIKQCNHKVVILKYIETMPRKSFSNAAAVVSLVPIIYVILLSSSSTIPVDAFCGLPTLSSSMIRISNSENFHCRHSSLKTPFDAELSSPEKHDRPSLPCTKDHQKMLQKMTSALRVSLLLLFSAPAIAPSFIPDPAFAAAAASETQGISVVTQSSLGTSVRSTVVQSAKLVDSVDLKWERFSDSLRDNKKCDPVTNRRLFDNGYRRDGTPIGNPVLGALCDPVPLRAVDESMVDGVLGGSLADAAYESLGSGMDKASLQQLVDRTRIRVRPAFERAIDAKASSASEDMDEFRKRQNYNLEVYSRIRAYGEALTTSTTISQATSSESPSAKPPSKAAVNRRAGKKLDLLWGRNLLDKLAGPATAKYEFRSPFPKPDPNIPFPYDSNQLTNALGAVEVALQKLQDGGLIGHWEISIPEDDYGEVVTIAVDDDVCLGAQILAREEQSVLAGSPVVAMVRSALEDRAKIPYVALDVFFIDPTTTKNELYNPTQLLVSVRNLGEEP